MDAIFTDKAEQLAREIASEAKTIDDLNGLRAASRCQPWAASRCQPLFLVFCLTAGFVTSNLPKCQEDCESSSKAPSIT